MKGIAGVRSAVSSPQWRRFAHIPHRHFVRCQAASSRANETSKEAYERRLRESQRVEERVVDIYDSEDFEREVTKADDNLVVLEIDSVEVCQSGVAEEPELMWKQDSDLKEKELWSICRDIKHVFQRTARECPDVKFLTLHADTDTGSTLCDTLGVDTIPTIQFYRKGKLLWQHKGAMEWQQDLGEGVLFYGDTFGGGKKASAHVLELDTEEDFDKYIASQDKNTLTVVGVSQASAEPCIRIFPAVLALARSLEGYATFARLVTDSIPTGKEFVKKHKIKEVPTFLFFRGGKEVDRLVSSSRADLIGHILQLQNAMGIPPPPVTRKGTPRRRKVA
ncbi:hypothetical protein BSKO_11509 [Bryopsis sp. KO-2023]|nr:hypothetical protein BSKO_11509 [Bryopsis sp. KO-2023]